MEFEHIGYFREYWVEGKYIGSINCEKDREHIGYEGRKIETLTEDLILSNKRKIKAGTEVKTLLYPLCGRVKS